MVTTTPCFAGAGPVMLAGIPPIAVNPYAAIAGRGTVPPGPVPPRNHNGIPVLAINNGGLPIKALFFSEAVQIVEKRKIF